MDTNTHDHIRPVEPDTGLLCFQLLARFHEIAVDAAQLRHELALGGRALDRDGILLAARRCGLKARRVCSSPARLSRVPLPAIAVDKAGHFFLIAQADDRQVLIQRPADPEPQRLTPRELEAVWTGELILMTRRSGFAGAGARFGWRWFLRPLYQYRRLFYEVLLASFFIQIFALATPLFFQIVVDKVLVHNSLTTLEVLALGLLVISLFDVLMNGLRDYLLAHTSSRIDVRLGAQLFGHLLSLPLGYFEARRVGHTTARVRELETLRSFITGSTMTLAIDVFFTFVFFVILFIYSVPLALLVAASLPAYVLLSAMVTPVLRRRLNDRFSRGAENQAFLVESVSGVETLKACALEPQTRRRWEDQLAGYVQASFRAGNLGNIASQFSNLINKLTTLGILWLGARYVMDGSMTVGQLVAFNMLAGRISGPILKLVSLWQEYQQAGISLQRLGDILDTPAEPGLHQARTQPGALSGRIEFRNVCFSYAPNLPEALADVSFNLQPGSVVGIVGRSGSGKSTLTKLVQRMYVPGRGRVLVDNMDVSLLDPGWLRRQVGVVLQDSFMFNRSIRENIALIDPGMPTTRVMAAAKLAGAHDFIAALPQAYDTLIEEQGANLSGGQKQRIAIARALVADPRILIFDEATSALDYESERQIQDNMRDICRGRTVLIIAHRLSAVRFADRILVLDQGRVVEQGTHGELLGAAGHYAALHGHQGVAHAVCRNCGR